MWFRNERYSKDRPEVQLPSPVEYDGFDITVRNDGSVALRVISPNALIDINEAPVVLLPGDARTYRAFDNKWWTVSDFKVPFRCRVHALADTEIVDGLETDVVFDTEQYDEGGFWTASDPTAFTIPFDGKYAVGGSVIIASDGLGNGVRWLEIHKGTTAIAKQSGWVSRVEPTPIAIHCENDFIAGDKVKLTVFQDSGGNLFTQSEDYLLSFWIHLLR